MKGRWWNSEWFVGALIVVAFALTLRQDPLAGIEGWGYDLISRLAMPAQVDDGLVIISVDEAVGHNPGKRWPREQARLLLERLHDAGSRAVTLVWPLEDDNYRDEMDSLVREAEWLLGSQPQSDSAPLLQRVVLLTSGEQRLADAMRAIGQLTLAAVPSAPWSEQWRWDRQTVVAPAIPMVSGELDVAPLFLAAAGTLAHDTVMSSDSVVRRVPLVYQRSDGAPVPTLPLLLLAQRLRVEPSTLNYSPPGELSLGDAKLATDGAGYLHPRWSRGSVRTIPLASVLDGSPKLLASLRDRIVLVGPTTPRLTPLATLPDGRRVAPLELAALTVSALVANETVVIPHEARWAQLGALLLVALLLTLLLPRLGNGAMVVMGAVAMVVLINAQVLLYLLRHEWWPLLVPLLALSTGLLLLLLRRRLTGTFIELRHQLDRVTVALAQQLRQQGQFDDALFHLQQCPVALAGDELYNLGIDYERKRQFARAEQVFSHIVRDNPGFRDSGERVRINRAASERVVIAGHPSSNMAATMVMDNSALQKPVVGRYQVEREVGRGAMGMVYLGHDPKISRTVAIKTMLLTDGTNDSQLKEVRERFFREAESAGRLRHPHIVTIYDAGEEGDLAYIAMDFLTGVSLEHHTSQEQLLPVDEVMLIIDQVAQALDYAHGNGVIHRDIKPANIIYDRERRMATVTDFGVAHMADASKTRTGTILGTPYYMAPEQLAGGKVDGRADLFSLGVTLYQLLTGSLPFEGDSIASLMYKITHSRHVSVSKLRRGVPSCASRIVNQLLHKEVEKRCQSGGELHKALQRCMS